MQQLAQEYQTSFADFDTLASAYLAFGPVWQPPHEYVWCWQCLSCTLCDRDLKLQRLVDNVESLSFEGALSLALSYLLRPSLNVSEFPASKSGRLNFAAVIPKRENKTMHVLDEILTQMMSTIRVQGQTAYVSYQLSAFHLCCDL